MRLTVAGLLRRVLVSTALAFVASIARDAEPYLAVQTGQRCAQCHVNQTGGGMRTPFGNAFARGPLAARAGPDGDAWLGRVSPQVAVGANVRASATSVESNGERRNHGLELREARLFLSVTPIADRLSFYLDQYLRPGASHNRELFALYRSADGEHYLKAGRIYLPFGWRLQDNEAFVRSQTSIDMIGPDRGVEVGYDRGPVSLQLAVSNGSFGERDVDRGGLAELATIDDRAERLRSSAWLVEADWRVVQGHNLKFSGEGLDPDHRRGADRQRRLGIVYEYTPVGFLQLRAGHRRIGTASATSALDRRLSFVELHGFF